MVYKNYNIRDIKTNKPLTEAGKSRVLNDILNFNKFCCFGLVSSFLSKFSLETNMERHSILIDYLNKNKHGGHELNGVWVDEEGNRNEEKSIIIGFKDNDSGYNTTIKLMKMFGQEAVIFGEEVKDEKAFWLIYNNNPLEEEDIKVSEIDILQETEIGTASEFSVEKTLYSIYKDMSFSLSENKDNSNLIDILYKDIVKQ